MFLNDLFEAPLNPGDRKEIELKIANAEDLIHKVKTYKAGLQKMTGAPKLPGTEKEYDAMIAAYQNLIDKLQAQLDSDKSSNNFERFMQGVIKNCPTVIAACKKTNLVLYRGTRMTSVAFYGKPYDERYAKDSVSTYHRAFNYALEQAGVQARRDNSLFCTTNRSLAGNFGSKIYIIFPRDPVYFTWSDKIKDLVLSTENVGDMVPDDKLKEVLTAIWQKEDVKNLFVAQFGKAMYMSGLENVSFDPNTFNRETDHYFNRYNMYATIKSALEVAHLLDPPANKFADLKEWVDFDTIVKNFGLHFNDDLAAAMNQHYEITIRAPYYAIQAKFEPQIREYLKLGSYTSDDDMDPDLF